MPARTGWAVDGEGTVHPTENGGIFGSTTARCQRRCVEILLKETPSNTASQTLESIE